MNRSDALKKRRVLIVDDDPIVCRVTSRWLEHHGADVMRAYDIDSARLLMEKWPHDVVVLDYVFDSGRLGTELLQLCPEIPKIFFTGANIALPVDCRVVRKPDVHALVEAVRLTLEGNTQGMLPLVDTETVQAPL